MVRSKLFVFGVAANLAVLVAVATWSLLVEPISPAPLTVYAFAGMAALSMFERDGRALTDASVMAFAVFAVFVLEALIGRVTGPDRIILSAGLVAFGLLMAIAAARERRRGPSPGLRPVKHS